jgi:hypothetical protein
MRKHFKTKRRSARTKKNKSKKRRGGQAFKVVCCECEKKVDLSVTLIPRKCSSKRGYNAHRICEKCWWGDETKPGFADENGSHKCPGCEKGRPLPNLPKKQGVIEVIDIDD